MLTALWFNSIQKRYRINLFLGMHIYAAEVEDQVEILRRSLEDAIQEIRKNSKWTMATVTVSLILY